MNWPVSEGNEGGTPYVVRYNGRVDPG